ncbi:deoxyribose-phosphate aldolase [Taklimakanibacter lacteus]|uniref:deoxyribose-phosphate aldolase n=1 Tax=Taklimakanibacter lacteus TaxID=2268456 RepID=UPI000E66481D
MSGVAILPLNKPGHNGLPRNAGMPLALDLIDDIRLNFPAAERRIAALPGRRTVKKDAQAAWLLKAITCIDLTTLAGDDTPERVRRLCAKAINPVRPDLLEALGMADRHITTGAVCVYHRFVATAVEALRGSGIPVAAVSTGFPAGLVPHDVKLREIEASVADGAKEIDIVITREYALTQNWQALYDEMRDFRAACGDAHVKAILATGDLKTLRNVAKAAMVCMMAGADFIKTSTGKEAVNATLLVTLAMLRMIRSYQDQTGFKVGFKPAGGISAAKDILNYQILMKEELGREWLEPDLFRIGASSLLADIERQLEHHVTGRYSAFNRHAAG